MRDRHIFTRVRLWRGMPAVLPTSASCIAACLLRSLTRAVSSASAVPILHILFLLFLLLFPHRASGQDVRENFVRCDTYLDSLGRHRTVSVQWFDGLGRPTVSATDGLSPDGTVARGLREHDALGRVVREWLPGIDVSGGVLECRGADAVRGLSVACHGGDSVPFTSYAHDAQGRTVSVRGPGQEWDGRQASVEYGFNTAEGRQVKRYRVGAGGGLSEDGVWAAGTLRRKKSTDEDGRTLETFTDPWGRKALERRAGDNDTYFVHDGAGQLRFVLTPMMQEDWDLERHAYEYRYDSRGRCVWKRVPGCAATEYWYDNADRVVCERDGALRECGRVRFTLYDRLGRPAVTGTCTNAPESITDTRVEWTPAEGICNTGYMGGCTGRLDSVELEKAVWYDDHNFLWYHAFLNCPHLQRMRGGNTAHAKGHATGTMTATSGGEYVYSVSYYTEKGEECDRRVSLPGGRLLTVRTDYTFTGKPARVAETVEWAERENGADTSKADSVVTEYGYSNVNDALLTVDVSRNGMDAVRVSKLGYDSFGRVAGNTLHRHAGRIGNTWNIRGWLTGTGGAGYRETLHYNTPVNGADAVWGGDVSESVDEYSQAPAEKGWDIPNTLTTGYRYDSLGRLVESLPDDSAHSHAERVTYDANGNITTLKRWGMYAPVYYSLVDDLVYRYDGNRLSGVTDRVPYIPYVNEFGFRSGGAGDVDYEYNSDGAMTRDPHKGVSVSYSRRGTPKRAKFDSGSFTDWEYTADGVRLGTWWHTAVTGARGFAAEAEEENTTGIQAQTKPEAQAETAGASHPSPHTAPIYGYVENSEEFAGNYVFEDGKLSKYLFDGGYIDIASGQNTAAYRFYVRDHLGSVRVVLDDDGNVLQQLYYHPFGGVWGDAGTDIGLQPWKYSGKEYDHRDGLDLYDYGARLYDPAAVRWTSPDPLCEKYYHISPYAFCNNNPIKYVDPDGKYVEVSVVSNGVYKVTGGKADSDMNIYVNYGTDKQSSIGTMLTQYSFMDESGKAVVGSVINLSDKSGQEFLDDFTTNTPSLIYYIFNASGGKKYDFKTNGTGDTGNTIYHNRGMKITAGGKTYIASARDIGNFAAGYIAAKKGMSWQLARLGFDTLETVQHWNSKEFGLFAEGQPSQLAQKKGYEIGGQTKAARLMKCAKIALTALILSLK